MWSRRRRSCATKQTRRASDHIEKLAGQCLVRGAERIEVVAGGACQKKSRIEAQASNDDDDQIARRVILLFWMGGACQKRSRIAAQASNDDDDQIARRSRKRWPASTSTWSKDRRSGGNVMRTTTRPKHWPSYAPGDTRFAGRRHFAGVEGT